LEYSTSSSPLRWHLTNESFDIDVDGKVDIPVLPGLGVSLNMDTVHKYRVG
jgi:L-alanine-DL-glutamate epimerase-like enolase superfamily enzyme